MQMTRVENKDNESEIAHRREGDEVELDTELNTVVGGTRGHELGHTLGFRFGD